MSSARCGPGSRGTPRPRRSATRSRGTVTSLLGLVGIADPLSSREHVLLSNLVENVARGQEPRPRGADRPDPGAAAPQARRLRDRRVLPAEGAHRARAEAERARRLALVRGVGGRPGARPRDAPPHARRQAPLRDRLPRAPVGPGAPVRRHAPPVQARHVDARPAGHVGPADARLHGRGRRLRPAHGDAASEEADPHDPQARPTFGSAWCSRRRTQSTSTTRPWPTPARGSSAGSRPSATRPASSRACVRRREADVGALDVAIGGLQKRQFLLVSAKSSAPALHRALGYVYLRGPDEKADRDPHEGCATARAVPEPVEAPTPSAVPADLRATRAPSRPRWPNGVPVRFLDTAAPWAAEVGASSDGGRLHAFLAARVSLRFDDTKADLDHTEWERRCTARSTRDSTSTARRRLTTTTGTSAPRPRRTAATCSLRRRSARQKFFRDATSQIQRRLVDNRTLEIRRNRSLKLCSRPGETPDQFASAADQRRDEADRETAKLRDRLEAKRDRLEDALETARRRVRARLERAVAPDH